MRCWIGHKWHMPWQKGARVEIYEYDGDDLPIKIKQRYFTYCERCGLPRTKNVAI